MYQLPDFLHNTPITIEVWNAVLVAEYIDIRTKPIFSLRGSGKGEILRLSSPLSHQSNYYWNSSKNSNRQKVKLWQGSNVLNSINMIKCNPDI